MDDYTCENCEYSKDEEGLLICSLDDRVKDDDMTCEKWIKRTFIVGDVKLKSGRVTKQLKMRLPPLNDELIQ